MGGLVMPSFHRAGSGARREGLLQKSETWRSVKRSGYAIPRHGIECQYHPVQIPFHGITLPPSRFGPSKASSHSSFPTPPTLDAVRPRVVEENITTAVAVGMNIKEYQTESMLRSLPTRQRNMFSEGV